MSTVVGTSLGAGCAEGAIFARVRRNLGWLLGGRGFQAVASLVYLGLAARALGPAGFGAFTLLLAFAETIANLAQFQSWQSVVRYGALHRASARERRLERLLGLTAALDVASALFGAAAAIGGAALIGRWLGWSFEVQCGAAILATVLTVALGTTPLGILRLYDRFDLVTYIQGIGPVIRLIGAIGAWTLQAGIEAFLAIWACGALLQTATAWAIALLRVGRKPALGKRNFLIATRENTGILRFMLVTNLSSTLTSLPEQAGTLAVGGVSGPVTAGGFRLAAKLSKSLARPIQLLAIVILPEFARLTADRNHAVLKRVASRANYVAGILALIFVAIMAAWGESFLQLLSGISYQDAGKYLLLFSIAAAIQLSGFALDPLLTAYGRPDRVLAARIAAAVAYLILLAALLPVLGPVGAALATLGSSLFVRIRLAFAARATQALAD